MCIVNAGGRVILGHQQMPRLELVDSWGGLGQLHHCTIGIPVFAWLSSQDPRTPLSWALLPFRAFTSPLTLAFRHCCCFLSFLLPCALEKVLDCSLVIRPHQPVPARLELRPQHRESAFPSSYDGVAAIDNSAASSPHAPLHTESFIYPQSFIHPRSLLATSRGPLQVLPPSCPRPVASPPCFDDEPVWRLHAVAVARAAAEWSSEGPHGASLQSTQQWVRRRQAAPHQGAARHPRIPLPAAAQAQHHHQEGLRREPGRARGQDQCQCSEHSRECLAANQVCRTGSRTAARKSSRTRRSCRTTNST